MELYSFKTLGIYRPGRKSKETCRGACVNRFITEQIANGPLKRPVDDVGSFIPVEECSRTFDFLLTPPPDVDERASRDANQCCRHATSSCDHPTSSYGHRGVRYEDPDTAEKRWPHH